MLHLMLQRAGVKANHKRIYRLYKLEGLSVRTKKRKRLVARARTVLAKATRPNERWSMDFVSDITWGSRRFRIFAVVDDFTRETLALIVESSIGGARVAREMEKGSICSTSVYHHRVVLTARNLKRQATVDPYSGILAVVRSSGTVLMPLFKELPRARGEAVCLRALRLAA